MCVVGAILCIELLESVGVLLLASISNWLLLLRRAQLNAKNKLPPETHCFSVLTSDRSVDMAVSRLSTAASLHPLSCCTAIKRTGVLCCAASLCRRPRRSNV